MEELSFQEKKWLDLLAQYLIPRGWSADYSCRRYWELIKDNDEDYPSKSTVDRFLKKLEDNGFIEIKRGGQHGGRASNYIFLKKYKYHGICLTGVVPLDSPLYINRGADESCKHLMSAVSHTGTIPFIRIKSARHNGKTSLLIRLRQFLQNEKKCKVILVDLKSIDHSILNDETEFFNKFTELILSEFNEENQYNRSSTLLTKMSAAQRCTELLEPVFRRSKNIVLIIDGVDCILHLPSLKTSFTGLLRTWHESKMKMIDNSSVSWARIAIAYSTEPYSENDIRDSPFDNVGTPIDLYEFTVDQISNLADIYGLDWNTNDISKLMGMIEGHPYLVNLALYNFSTKRIISLEHLEKIAISETSPFISHLRKCMSAVEKNPDLYNSIKKLLNGQKIDRRSEFYLTMLGIVKQNIDSNEIEFRCDLYKQYFSNTTLS